MRRIMKANSQRELAPAVACAQPRAQGPRDGRLAEGAVRASSLKAESGFPGVSFSDSPYPEVDHGLPDRRRGTLQEHIPSPTPAINSVVSRLSSSENSRCATLISDERSNVLPAGRPSTSGRPYSRLLPHGCTGEQGIAVRVVDNLRCFLLWALIPPNHRHREPTVIQLCGSITTLDTCPGGDGMSSRRDISERPRQVPARPTDTSARKTPLGG